MQEISFPSAPSEKSSEALRALLHFVSYLGPPDSVQQCSMYFNKLQYVSVRLEMAAKGICTEDMRIHNGYITY